MPLNLERKIEQPTTEPANNTEQKGPRHEQGQTGYFEAVSRNNLSAKKAMVMDLVEIGLSREAIERILHVKIGGIDARQKDG